MFNGISEMVSRKNVLDQIFFEGAMYNPRSSEETFYYNVPQFKNICQIVFQKSAVLLAQTLIIINNVL